MTGCQTLVHDAGRNCSISKQGNGTEQGGLVSKQRENEVSVHQWRLSGAGARLRGKDYLEERRYTVHGEGRCVERLGFQGIRESRLVSWLGDPQYDIQNLKWRSRKIVSDWMLSTHKEHCVTHKGVAAIEPTSSSAPQGRRPSYSAYRERRTTTTPHSPCPGPEGWKERKTGDICLNKLTVFIFLNVQRAQVL